jgi:hypothetical protein
MIRWIFFLPFFLGLSACQQRKVSPAAPQPDFQAVKVRAGNSLSEASPAVGEPKKAAPSPSLAGPLAAEPKKATPPPATTPETPAPASKIGEKDTKLGCTWVESDATVSVGEETREQARARTIERALGSAMRDLLGVEVNQRSLDFHQESLRGQSSLIESVLRTTRRGCILNQNVLTEEYRDLGTCHQCGFYVDLKACIKERPEGWNKDFQVEASLSSDRFVEGEEAKITVTSRSDAYLYIYDVGMNSETSLLVPNEIVPEAKILAGGTWVYPDEKASKAVHLTAQLPESRTPVSAETIRVVATKTALPAKVVDPAKGGYLGVLQRLDSANVEWTEDTAAFTIVPAKEK